MRGISAFAIIMLAVYLLLPQRLFSYNPCCLDAGGHLRRAPGACCGSGTEEKIAGPSCCDPIETILRDSAPSDSTSPQILEPAREWADASAATTPAPIELVSSCEAAGLRRQTTGPPDLRGVLAFHSRLNL